MLVRFLLTQRFSSMPDPGQFRDTFNSPSIAVTKKFFDSNHLPVAPLSHHDGIHTVAPDYRLLLSVEIH